MEIQKTKEDLEKLIQDLTSKKNTFQDEYNNRAKIHATELNKELFRYERELAPLKYNHYDNMRDENSRYENEISGLTAQVHKMNTDTYNTELSRKKTVHKKNLADEIDRYKSANVEKQLTSTESSSIHELHDIKLKELNNEERKADNEYKAEIKRYDGLINIYKQDLDKLSSTTALSRYKYIKYKQKYLNST